MGNKYKLRTEGKAKGVMGKIYIGCTFETSRPIIEGGKYQDHGGEEALILMNRQVGKLRCSYLDFDLNRKIQVDFLETYMIFFN